MTHPRPRIRIPERHHEGFRWLASLDDRRVGEIVAALREVGPTTSGSQLADRLVGKADLPTAKLRLALTALYSLRITAETLQIPLERMVEEVAASAADEDLGVTEDDQEDFQARLSRLLDPDLPLSVGAHAASVLMESGQNYVNARVISDIRPIFRQDDPSEASSAAILHTLRIEVHVGHGGTDHRDFFFTMGLADVHNLMEQLQRAVSKHSALRRVLEAGGLKYLDTDSTLED